MRSISRLLRMFAGGRRGTGRRTTGGMGARRGRATGGGMGSILRRVLR